ncbi:ATP-dependent RNA helicase dbp4 [Gonapodya sp. JEL0774]|nr:ATP-dependent RNA helicase dbp4 [Gonapodya sp. JEL0774]
MRKKSKKDTELKEIEELNERIEQELATPNQNLRDFEALPLSQNTFKGGLHCYPWLTLLRAEALSSAKWNGSFGELYTAGLSDAHFVEMTDIQMAALPPCLRGRDVLGAAKTGSGKTLAFIIPILELLYRERWSHLDGVGAIVVSPTRELALQIFETLRSVGHHHTFSAGLLIGGKNLKDEQDRVNRMNILVATPGRLLQHMDQTPDFNCDNLKMLVLDEADRLLDLGFSKTLNAIVENLPKVRQTLLFSATQTKSVSDLARLSLVDPEYVAVHEQAAHATPGRLVQRFMVVELGDKLDLLHTFLRTHLKSKILVFMSACKQVRFVFETFRRLQPGIPLMCLHGKQKQAKRLSVFDAFSKKKNVCLFATDIASRGLDFPAVDWVVQLDCPEDAATYIHRVGRTARYESSGSALMFLLPSEKEGMVEALDKVKVPIEEVKANLSKVESVKGHIAGFCAQDPEIRYLGQKAFVSYIRSVHIASNKKVFKVHEMPAAEFAASYGLPGIPKIKFVAKAKLLKNAPRPAKVDDSNIRKKSDPKIAASSDEDSVSTSEDDIESDLKWAGTEDRRRKDLDRQPEIGSEGIPKQKKAPLTRVDRLFQRKNQTVLSEHYQKMTNPATTGFHPDALDPQDTDLFELKRKDHQLDGLETETKPPVPLSKRQLIRRKEKELKSRGLGKKAFFDDEGNAVPFYQLEHEEKFHSSLGGDIQTKITANLESTRQEILEQDAQDKVTEKGKRREKKLAKKEKERKKMGNESKVARGSVVLGRTPDMRGDNSETDEDFADHLDGMKALHDDSDELGSESEEDDRQTNLGKRRKSNHEMVKNKRHKAATLEEDEERALQLLQNVQ